MLGFKLSKLYGILDTASLYGVTPIEVIDAFIEAGVTIVQIRHKGDSKSFYQIVETALKAAEDSITKITINDRPDIALITQAAGVHLGQDDLPPSVARKILGDDAVIGISTHTIEQLRTAAKEPVDYISFGPIFESFTKKGGNKPLGLEMLTLAKQLCLSKPIVAIGGITLKNISQAISAGADSAAIISDIYNAEDPVARIKLLNRPQNTPR
ncbi:MAG: thiamine phosphate synthase [Myxococcota bacterium]